MNLRNHLYIYVFCILLAACSQEIQTTTPVITPDPPTTTYGLPEKETPSNKPQSIPSPTYTEQSPIPNILTQIQINPEISGCLICLSDNGDQLATYYGAIYIYSFPAGALLHEMPIPYGPTDPNVKTAIVFSPTGHLLASGGQENQVDIYNVDAGELVQSLTMDDIFGFDFSDGGYAPITSLLFISDDSLLIGAGPPNGGVALISLQNYSHEVIFNKPVSEIAVHLPTAILAFATQPVGVFRETDSPVVVYDLHTKQVRLNLFGEEALPEEESNTRPGALSVSISESGEFIAAVVEGAVRVFNVPEGNEIEIPQTVTLNTFSKVEFVHPSKLVVVEDPCYYWLCQRTLPYSGNCKVFMLDTMSWEVVDYGELPYFYSMVVTADGELMITGSGEVVEFWKVPK